MKKILLITIAVLLYSNQSKSQDVLADSTSSYLKVDAYYKEPVPYQPIREADVVWSTKIWRVLDLREKINQVLYFPMEPKGNKDCLIRILAKAIEEKKITAFKAPPGNAYEFQDKMTFDEVKVALGAVKKKISVTDPVTGETTQREIEQEMNFKYVRQYMIKEEWVMDKNTSTLSCRLLGLCPILEGFKEGADAIEDNVIHTKLFWVYYPEIRKVLCNREITNSLNSSESLTFDQFLFLRKFNSYIVKSEKKEKFINEYTNGRASQIEAAEIEEELFNKEHDMWQW